MVTILEFKINYLCDNQFWLVGETNHNFLWAQTHDFFVSIFYLVGNFVPFLLFIGLFD